MMGFWTSAAVVGVGVVAFVAKPLARALGVTRAIALGAGVVVVAGLIWALGGPGGPPQPLDARLADIQSRPITDLSTAERAALLEGVTRQRPDDPQAWKFLGDEYRRLTDFDAAAAAYQRAAQLDPSAQAYVRVAEAMTAANRGEINQGARLATQAALRADPEHPEALFFAGLAALQAGAREEAEAAWGASALSGRARGVERSINALLGPATDLLARPQAGPDLGGDGPAPFLGEDPEAAIEGMIAALAARLDADPERLSGWLALARARAITGDLSGAAEALDAAQEVFADDAERLALINLARGRFLAPRDPMAPSEGIEGQRSGDISEF